MKLSVLADNKALAGFEQEHGLSFLLEKDQEMFLFDTGASNLFLRNARKMGLNIDQVGMVILSHGHWDHGNGLRYIENKTLVMHPEAFKDRYRTRDNSYIGLDLSAMDIAEKFELILSREATLVDNGLYFMGEIQRRTQHESKTTSFIDESGKPDFVPDDSALLLVQEDCLSIIAGCSHAGIINIILQAKAMTGISRIKMIAGGLHLKEMNEQAIETIKMLQEMNIGTIYPSHCTGDRIIEEMSKTMHVEPLMAGMQITF